MGSRMHKDRYENNSRIIFSVFFSYREQMRLAWRKRTKKAVGLITVPTDALVQWVYEGSTLRHHRQYSLCRQHNRFWDRARQIYKENALT